MIVNGAFSPTRFHFSSEGIVGGEALLETPAGCFVRVYVIGSLLSMVVVKRP